MSWFKNKPSSESGLSGALTQGGQTSLHSLHMLKQVIGSTSRLSLNITLLFWLGMVSYNTPFHRLYALWSVIKGWVLIAFSGDFDRATQWFAYPGMEAGFASSWQVANNTALWNEIWRLFSEAYRAFIPSMIVFPIIWCVLIVCWMARGIHNKRKRIIEGHVLLTAKQGKRAIRKLYKPSNISLAGLPLPEGAAQQHILISGTTGSGKTNALRSLLKQIRDQGDRALVVDLRGSLLSQFYEPSKDTILNPFDQRSPKWNIFEECEDPNHMDMMAECLVPTLSHHETFWTDAARTLLSTGLQELRTHSSDHPHKNLIKHLIQMPLPKIQRLFAHTLSAALVDPQGDRMAVSIRATLTKSLKPLLYCDDGQGEAFSIRKWVQQENQEGDWLWLVAQSDQRATLKGLMASWFATAVLTLKNMPETSQRRLWLIIDELPQMGKLPALAEALEEVRGFGGCIVAGVQDIHQLDHFYGNALSQTLISLFNTKVLFRVPNYEVATRLSHELGKNEISEKIENISYGSHEMRDGVSLNDVRKQGFAVKPQDLMNLKVGEAILKTLNIAPIHAAFKKFDAVTKFPACSKKTNLFELLKQGDQMLGGDAPVGEGSLAWGDASNSSPYNPN